MMMAVTETIPSSDDTSKVAKGGNVKKSRVSSSPMASSEATIDTVSKKQQLYLQIK